MAESDINVKATEEPIINNNKSIEEGTENGSIIKMHGEGESKEELPTSKEKKDVVDDKKCDEEVSKPECKDGHDIINDNKDKEEVSKDSITENKSDDVKKVEENNTEDTAISKVIEENKIDGNAVEENKVDENKVNESKVDDKIDESKVEESKIDESKTEEDIKIDDNKIETKETEVTVKEDNITSVEEKESVEEVVKEDKTDSVVEEKVTTNSESTNVEESSLTVEKPKGRGRKASQGAPKIKEPIVTENGESIANSRPRRSTVKNVDYTGADTAAIWSALTPKGGGKKRTSIAKTVPLTKKGRGRKRKASSDGEDEMSEELSDPDITDKTPKKNARGKGGSKKVKASDDDDDDINEVIPPSKKRGTPKERVPVEKNEPKRRGRPSKVASVNGDDMKEENKNSSVTTSSNEANENDEQKMDTTTNCEETAVETN
uniref:Uncharacterized protein n=1 Tax=Strongyloides stercoralis TaxID=6248 RepID=A0AAF5CSC5_STRER